MEPPEKTALRKIPSVEALLQDPALSRWNGQVPRRLVADAVRAAVQETRGLLARACGAEMTAEAVRAEILARTDDAIRRAVGPHYRRAVNATGIILHTGLGRAPLPGRALGQIAEHLAGYSVLQTDIASGQRDRRDARIEWLLQQLTGCEAATVVNNNAAATMIALAALAAGREVIVSRGQLVEIGGSFRLPDVMAASGARLVEVGTTNKTHPRDYEQAITSETAAILRVHPSNYRIVGFTAEVPLGELVGIAHARGLLVIDDVGAGALLDFSRFGFTDQPRLPDSIREGADVVLSSADKLIGGPQGGLILGRAALVEKIRRHPLARILRVGKLTLAALEATLGLFFDEATALSEVPALALLARPLTDVAAQAERIAAAIRAAAPGATVATIEGASEMGSGSMPAQPIPTRLVAVAIRPTQGDPEHGRGVASEKTTPDELASRLRRHEPPVFARIQDGRVLLDPRTLLEGDEAVVVEALVAALHT
jgi:L-seryl-tRNA(Ser) seleniumtransferase